MAVAANGDVGVRPVPADTPHQPAQMAADLFAGRRLAGAQEDRNTVAAVRVIHVDRQKAALVVMGIE